MEDLRAWAMHYFKSRDAFTKSIVAIEPSQNGFCIAYKDRKDAVAVLPDLSQVTPAEMASACIVTLNQPKNIDALVARWQDFKARDMKILFANPAQPHRKWMINPLAHARVCDDASLKRGLYALAEELP